MSKSTTLTLLAIAAGATVALAACGRPSTDSRFGFDGTGDPTYPPQNLIHGKYAGNVEITQFKSYEKCAAGATKSCYGGLFSNIDDLYLSQGYFNQTPLEGIAGAPLLAFHSATPPRTPGTCFTTTKPFPVIGGTFDWLDVGQSVFPYPSTAGVGQTIGLPMAVNPGSHGGPQVDALYSYGAYDASYDPADGQSIRNVTPQNTVAVASTDDVDLTMQWAGGSFGSAGYPIAPPRVDKTSEVIHAPPALQNILVNGTAFGAVATIGTASNYVVSWTPWNTTRALDHQFGVAITVQVYGPADLSANGSLDVEDWPWFNELGEMTCLVNDGDGTYTLPQSAIDSLVALAKTTKAYALSTKDSNHDGQLAPYSCVNGPGGLSCGGEDSNGDGHDDKIMGVAMIVNRRTESQFQACVKGESANNCSRQAPVFISANDLHIARMATYQPH